MSAAPDFRAYPRPPERPLWERAALFLAAAALVLASATALRSVRAREDEYAELTRGRREVEALSTRLRALDQAVSRGSTLRRQAELTARASPPWVIADLALLLPPDARIERLELQYRDRLALELAVEARSPAAYDRLLDALSSSGRLEALVPGPEVREGQVDSSLKAVYRPREEP